jgi:diguanylate cyclase (GGDEF)-like protein
MRYFAKKFLPWLGAFVQPVTILGVAMMALLWIGAAFHLHSEYNRAIQDNTQETSNIARVLEENLTRNIQNIDRSLLFLRASWNAGTFETDLRRWANDTQDRREVELQISFIDKHGMLKASSLGPILKPTDLSDRDHFRAHLGHDRDELYLSKPLIGRMSGKWSIQLSRPIRDAKGDFVGVIVGSIDPFYWVRVFNAVSLGKSGAVRLFGLDGIIRAANGVDGKDLGRTMEGTPLLKRATQRPIDTYLSSGAFDGNKRLISYRVFKEAPLIIMVGVGQDEMFATYYRNRTIFLLTATALTVLILYVMWFGIQRQNKIDSFRAAWRASEAVAKEKSRVLGITLENINQGIMMIDPEGNIAVVNRRVIELLDLPEKFLGPRIKLSEMVQFLWDRGEFGVDGEKLDGPVLKMLRCGTGSDAVPLFERERPNGTVLEVASHRLEDGSIVRTFTDITERKRTERQIAHMAHHDNLTNLPNRILLNDRLEQALARMKRQKSGFALFCLDLDGFKKVNDTFGHGAGDLLLKEISQRLAKCVREVDTVARIGGDEFVIIQEDTVDEAQAAILAERIKTATGLPCSINGNEVMVGTSIGIAMAPRDGTVAAELMRNADKALYRAKSKGRNLFSFVNGDKHAVVKPKADAVVQAAREIGPAEETVHIDEEAPLAPYTGEPAPRREKA